MMKKFLLLCMLLITISAKMFANNIQVNNVSLTGQNTTSDFVMVNFDLSWENSWRISVGPSNWDAAWVFIKYRVNNGDWFHARLNYVNGSNDGHTAPGGATIRTANDGLAYGLGAFIYRSADGSGDINWQNIQLRWDYGLTGVGDNDLVDVQVFAVEMVYVPQGPFSVGGGAGAEYGKFYSYPTTSNAYAINSENAITVGTGTGNLYYPTGSGANAGDQAGPVPAAFPKGYKAFYCMKYEMSQDQWISFFNTLTTSQKLANDLTDATHKNSDAEVARNAISWSGTGNASTTLPNVPVSFINWNNSNAYLDWAALRPMSELEFVKACRGPLPAVTNEYAWGNNNIYNTAYTLTGKNSENEGISNPGTGTGNALYASTNSIDIAGPTRCGIFAASAVSKTREESGGSYFGIMELSGSLYERVVTIGTPLGRAFNGLHGDGSIAADGLNNTANWITVGGYVGGSFANGSEYLQISTRYDAANVNDFANTRIGATRGVRTAN